MRHLRPVPNELLKRPDMARRLGVSLRTFDEMRSNGRKMGLPCPEVNWGHRMLRYEPADVWEWAESYSERRRAA